MSDFERELLATDADDFEERLPLLVGKYLESKSCKEEVEYVCEAFSESIAPNSEVMEYVRGAFHTSNMMQEKMYQAVGREFVAILVRYFEETIRNEWEEATSFAARKDSPLEGKYHYNEGDIS